jgi:hypothetical protein
LDARLGRSLLADGGAVPGEGDQQGQNSCQAGKLQEVLARSTGDVGDSGGAQGTGDQAAEVGLPGDLRDHESHDAGP